MATLYEISEQLQSVIDGGMVIDEETGEILFDQDNLDELEMELDRKLEGCALFVKNLEADAEAIKREEEALRKRRKSLESKSAWMKGYVQGVLKGSFNGKFQTPKVKLSMRRSQSVQIVDEQAIPNQYVSVSYTSKVDKVALKKALKEGEVPGAILQINENLSIC